MPIVFSFGKRKAIEINKTLFASMPSDWCKIKKIEKGNEVEILLNDNGNLVIKPVPKESEN